MAKVVITNEKQLVYALNRLSRDLLVYLSKKVMAIMKRNLRSGTNISTTSMQKGVDYSINAQGTEATIYIDYEFVEDAFAEPPIFFGGKMVEWGQFMNTFGADKGSRMWNGQPISFRMAEWLQYGGSGNIGNQPISANKWFSKTENEVRLNLDKWVKTFILKNFK